MNKKNLTKVENLYFDPKKPASFSGLSTFKKEYKKKLDFKNNEFKDLFLNLEEYTLHKPIRKKFQENRVIVLHIDDTWQADLIDLSKLANENENYKYLITVIDVFSKYAWVEPLLNKKPTSIIEAFKKIFKESKRKPEKIQTDQGLEFISKASIDYFKSQNISHYFIYSRKKACVVERFNRTFKQKLWRYFTYNGNYNYLSVLQDLVFSYNNTYHRSIKNKPSKITKKNEDLTFLNLYGYDKQTGSEKTLKLIKELKIGDKVRLVLPASIFKKGYTQNWTDQIYEISDILYRDPVVYKLRSDDDILLNGIYYKEELQKIYNFEKRYTIEKVLKSRIKNGKKEVLVKWKGWDKKYNSWVSADSIE